MGELLTVKEVQDLLKVDRITVYRMLKDGRLAGIKIGHQWRFSRRDVDSLLSGERASEGETIANPPTDVLPLHCVQLIQNVFAEVAMVGSVTTGPDGEPLTSFSNSCTFCNLVLASET